MRVGKIELNWLGHSSFLINNGRLIYIDPYNLSKVEKKADIILITHSHYDHCSIPDIEKIAKDGTTIVLPADCQSKITKLRLRINMQLIEPGDEISLGDIKIQAIPAYNLSKPNHPKSEHWNGYVIKFNNTIIYHAGDTDLIPEMSKLVGYGKKGNEFVALLPVAGPNMNAQEAAKAASIIKPTLAIPMHYGSVIGSEDDADRFVQLCSEYGIRAEKIGKS